MRHFETKGDISITTELSGFSIDQEGQVNLLKVGWMTGKD